MGSIESTVAYGPVYFNPQPNFQLSLIDANILDALTLNAKMNNYLIESILTDAVTNSDFSCISQNPDGRICIQFADNSYAPHRRSCAINKSMSSVNHSFNRHSLSSSRLLPTVHHISPIEPIHGPARDRAASLHTITPDSNSVVEKVKIDPLTNIVQVNDDVSDKDIPLVSEMEFDPNNS
ncbi:hypothetical protein H5410_031254 [Solanum commersonii]|uniref:Uncharacterized protein n=1 Tax=Solanum commersonii TaxID=4109 RepID=A0A9J5YL57_SOLCO|nr:hypothetical protein H5410_031254 [Solanum commersonii]